MNSLINLRQPLGLSLAIFIGFSAVNATVEAYIINDTANFSSALNPEFSTLPSIKEHFPRPVALNDAIAFWREVFGHWSTRQVILHDNKYLGITYETIILTGYVGGRLSATQQAQIDDRKYYWTRQLQDLEYRLHKRLPLSKVQRELYDTVVTKAGHTALKAAAERIRMQRGMRESFETGLKISNRYDAPMREVFRAYGLPEDLAYLPHVESAFVSHARSPAGAIGAWQFMPVTGKRYLRIDEALDERYDPILATEGAVRYLIYAYERLGDWALAITSYNYGLQGMLNARLAFGKDIVRIVNEYESDSFGFASRNYYVEFLAICDIMADLPRYFPKGIEYQPAVAVKKIRLTRDMTSGEIARKHKVNYTTLSSLNPAWTSKASKGLVALPANTIVWLPSASSKNPSATFMTLKNTTPDAVKLELGKLRQDFSWDVLSSFPQGLSGQLNKAALQIPSRLQVNSHLSTTSRSNQATQAARRDPKNTLVVNELLCVDYAAPLLTLNELRFNTAACNGRLLSTLSINS